MPIGYPFPAGGGISPLELWTESVVPRIGTATSITNNDGLVLASPTGEFDHLVLAYILGSNSGIVVYDTVTGALNRVTGAAWELSASPPNAMTPVGTGILGLGNRAADPSGIVRAQADGTISIVDIAGAQVNGSVATLNYLPVNNFLIARGNNALAVRTIWRSLDDGLTWDVVLSNNSAVQLFSSFAELSDGAILGISSSNGLWVSDTGGSTWVNINGTILGYSGIYVDSGDRIFLYSGSGSVWAQPVAFSDDGGATFTLSGSNFNIAPATTYNIRFNCLGEHLPSGRMFSLIGNDIPAISLDRGQTWRLATFAGNVTAFEGVNAAAQENAKFGYTRNGTAYVFRRNLGTAIQSIA